MATSASGKPKPLYLLVLGIVAFGGGGAYMLYLQSKGKATSFLSALGFSAAASAKYVTIVSWAGIALGALCLILLVRELRGRKR